MSLHKVTSEYSDFSVQLELIAVSSMAKRLEQTQGSSLLPQFGPNEFNVIREALECENELREEISLQFLQNLLEISHFDFQLYLDIQWIVFKKVKIQMEVMKNETASQHRAPSECDADPIHVHKKARYDNESVHNSHCTACLWAEIALKSFDSHFSTSFKSFAASRVRVLQFFMALGRCGWQRAADFVSTGGVGFRFGFGNTSSRLEVHNSVVASGSIVTDDLSAPYVSFSLEESYFIGMLAMKLGDYRTAVEILSGAKSQLDKSCDIKRNKRLLRKIIRTLSRASAASISLEINNSLNQ